jgi:hypothetical protein
LPAAVARQGIVLKTEKDNYLSLKALLANAIDELCKAYKQVSYVEEQRPLFGGVPEGLEEGVGVAARAVAAAESFIVEVAKIEDVGEARSALAGVQAKAWEVLVDAKATETIARADWEASGCNEATLQYDLGLLEEDLKSIRSWSLASDDMIDGAPAASLPSDVLLEATIINILTAYKIAKSHVEGSWDLPEIIRGVAIASSAVTTAELFVAKVEKIRDIEEVSAIAARILVLAKKVAAKVEKVRAAAAERVARRMEEVQAVQREELKTKKIKEYVAKLLASKKVDLDALCNS